MMGTSALLKLKNVKYAQISYCPKRSKKAMLFNADSKSMLRDDIGIEIKARIMISWSDLVYMTQWSLLESPIFIKMIARTIIQVVEDVNIVEACSIIIVALSLINYFAIFELIKNFKSLLR